MFSGTDAILIPPRVRDGEPDVATVAIGEGAPGELVVTCRVCQRAHAKYTCPRCFMRYCGLPCYKAHDGRCVESFHGENFGDALKGTRAEDEGKKRMTEILARFARMDAGDAGFQGDKVDSDDDDEDGDDDDAGASAPSSSGACILSEANLEKLARGEELCAEDLSPEERAAFERSAATGELSHMVEPWKAWWTLPEATDIVLASDGGRLVREVGSQVGSAVNDASPAVPPPPHESLPPLSRLTPVKPSPSLRWHLLDVLGAYTLTLRAHDGDWSADPLAAVAALLSLSAVLAAGAERPSRGTGGAGDAASTDLPCTAAAALHGVGSRAASSASGVMAAAAAAVSAGGMTRDILSLLRGGRGAAVVALADTRRMVIAAAAELSDRGAVDDVDIVRGRGGRLPRAGGGRSRLSRGALSRLERKVFFLLCWVNGLTDSARGGEDDRADEGVFEILRGRLEHELRAKKEAEEVAATRAAVVHTSHKLVAEVSQQLSNP